MAINKYEINIYEQIAKNIKKYRSEAGITQAELAERVGVSHEFIRRLESTEAKEGISLDLVYKISVVLETRIDKFFEVEKWVILCNLK